MIITDIYGITLNTNDFSYFYHRSSTPPENECIELAGNGLSVTITEYQQQSGTSWPAGELIDNYKNAVRDHSLSVEQLYKMIIADIGQPSSAPVRYYNLRFLVAASTTALRAPKPFVQRA